MDIFEEVIEETVLLLLFFYPKRIILLAFIYIHMRTNVSEY